jgi:hypothetical protein
MLVEHRVIIEAKATHKLRYADRLHVLATRRSIVPRSDPENLGNPGSSPNVSSR